MSFGRVTSRSKAAVEIMRIVILPRILSRSIFISLIIWCNILYLVNCVNESVIIASPLAIRVLQQFRDEANSSNIECEQDIDKILHGFTNHEVWSLRSELNVKGPIIR